MAKTKAEMTKTWYQRNREQILAKQKAARQLRKRDKLVATSSDIPLDAVPARVPRAATNGAGGAKPKSDTLRLEVIRDIVLGLRSALNEIRR